MIAVPDYVDLLLRLLEAREFAYTEDAVRRYYGPPGDELLRLNLLKPFGYDAFVIDETDGPVPVGSSVTGLGYRDLAGQWVAVNQEHLRRFRPDLPVLFQGLFGGDLQFGSNGLLELVPDLLWELGTVALGRREQTQVWFARRLFDQTAFDHLIDAVFRRPPTSLRLILTSSPHTRIPDRSQPMCCIVSISDVLEADRLRLSSGMLAARLAGRPSQSITQEVHLSDDDSTLTIRGEEIVFGGIRQRKTIRLIVAAYGASKGLNAAATLDKVGYGPSVRTFSQAFRKQWPQLGPHLKSRHTLWYLDVHP